MTLLLPLPPPPNAAFELSFLFQQLVLCLYATRLLLHRRAFQLFFWLLAVPQLALSAVTLLLFLGSGGAYPSALAILAQPLHFALVLACAAPRMYCSLYVVITLHHVAPLGRGSSHVMIVILV